MKYTINYERWYKKGKADYLFFTDGNIFKSNKDAIEHAINMVNMWKDYDDELFTFEVITL